MAGVALAAGAGSRLAPITDGIPKPLCPVANRPLIDHALDRLASVGADPAVNVHHHHERLIAWLGSRVHVSHEADGALGTAGAIGRLRDWLDGRPVVIVNADTWCPGSLAPLVDGWDGERVRVFVPGPEPFGPTSPIVGTLLPWRVARGLAPSPTGLFEVVWRDEHDAGRLEVVRHEGPWVDCGRPVDLLEANLEAMAGSSSIDATASVTGEVRTSAVGAGSTVAGSLRQSVVFAGASVEAGEILARCLRWLDAGGRTRTLQV